MSRRPWLSAIVLALSSSAFLLAQGKAELVQAHLKSLFPNAASFSPKEALPLPHFKAFGADGKLLGLAFYTTELEPLERGYDGPVKMLVGLDTRGIFAGIVVVQHVEPFGKFSVDTPRFAQQFKGKSVRDPFKPGEDLDVVATATITINHATRAVRKSARRVAVQMLKPDEGR
ncbi:MAG: FMN-binding protein [Vicinamibacterales bacterium]